MAALLERLKNEPALAVGIIVSIALAFGRQLTDAEVSGLTQTIEFLLPIIGSLVVRQNVTPAKTADARALKAYEDVNVEGHPGNPFPR